ncbi:hypothetical protein Ddc_00148 [Ditylenchus destructor]|nr:hypothetical protein Ddc_00148 [Ditylenchus destructor]
MKRPTIVLSCLCLLMAFDYVFGGLHAPITDTKLSDIEVEVEKSSPRGRVFRVKRYGYGGYGGGCGCGGYGGYPGGGGGFPGGGYPGGGFGGGGFPGGGGYGPFGVGLVGVTQGLIFGGKK